MQHARLTFAKMSVMRKAPLNRRGLHGRIAPPVIAIQFRYTIRRQRFVTASSARFQHHFDVAIPTSLIYAGLQY